MARMASGNAIGKASRTVLRQRGQSGNGYGKIPWDEAMNLPGSQQVGFGKKFLEQFRWQNFRPHPEWAEFVEKSSLSLDGCQWIWFPEGDPATNVPAAKRFFRRTFVLPDKAIKSARLRMSADDEFTVRLNDKILGTASNFKLGRQFNDLAPVLQPGTNLLAITPENKPAPGPNPAGLIAWFDVSFTNGDAVKITTDEEWRCATNNPSGWDEIEFDEAGWTNAVVIGQAGDSPWGKLDPLSNDDVYAPQSAGIPGVVRITYVPQPDAIVVRNLVSHGAYAASIFDPVTASTKVIGNIEADAEGLWKCSPPPVLDHDWVLVLETPNSNLLHEKHFEGHEGQTRHAISYPPFSCFSKLSPN